MVLFKVDFLKTKFPHFEWGEWFIKELQQRDSNKKQVFS